MAYGLRGARAAAAHALAAPIARAIAPMAFAAPGLPGDPVHEPVHVRDPVSRHPATVRNVADDMDPRPQAARVPGPTVDLYAATRIVRVSRRPILPN